jgi:hypothetical protein
MITCAYTILKNEKKFIEKWLFYTKKFTYRCLLDTGSTDGSWELLSEAQKSDPNLILEQKVFTPWNFSTARNYNLDMIPQEVEWCLSPDMDEYFSINVLPEMSKIITARPDVTNISTTRLDVYSDEVFVGPPNHLPSNKIHKRNDYRWVQPIYEHLHWINEGPEVELHSDKVYLVHDQDFLKAERSPLYLKMLIEEYHTNPSNTWTLWFLVNHYYREKDMENFIITGLDFIRHSDKFEKQYHSILQELTNIYLYADIPYYVKHNMYAVLQGRSIQ